jgi:F0F1-type ATP synthase membrane subunit b/b'
MSRSLGGRVRQAAFVGMVVVTSWSVWAWAQPKPAHPTTQPAAEEKEKAGEAEGEGPAPFNWTVFGGETPPYIAMLINFGILVAGYYLLGKKPIAAGLQNRRDTISKEIEEAQLMKREAEERAKTYQHKLEKLEDELRAARESLVQAGEAESERIVREAEGKAERMRKDAEFLVEQELKQIRGDLWRETVEAAVLAAEDLLKKRVTPADQERLAEEYLADLGGRNTRTTSIAPQRSVPPPVDSGSGSPS